ncbi:MAG: hypothetical protein RIG66_15785 [Coleofasciculus sp. E2-BRE-01]
MSQSPGLVETEVSFPSIVRSRYYVWIALHPDLAKEIATPNLPCACLTRKEKKLGVWKPPQTGFVCVAAVLTAQLTIMSNRYHV